MSLDQPGPDKLAMTITSLEMRARPALSGKPGRPSGRADQAARASASIVRSTPVSARTGCGAIGRRWSDDHLASVVQHEAVELWLLHVDGQPAGYAELDGRQPHETELAYFGLLPAYIGRGLGPRLLRFAIEQAWRRAIDRLWVHTCNFDHPAALGLYRRCGFAVFAEATHWIDDPRRSGLIRSRQRRIYQGPDSHAF